jgi:CHASE2 domain-containing sensor protein
MKLSTWLQLIRRFALEGKISPSYLGIFITCSVLWATHPQSSLVSSTDSNSGPTTYDQRLSIMPKPVKPPDNKIVIIDLDERSLQVEGQYPWNRIRVIFKA